MDRVEEPGQARVGGPESGVSDLGLLDALHLPVVAADLDQRIVYWNQAAEDFYGLTQEQLSETSMLDLHVGPDARERAHEIITTVSSGQRWVGELSVRCRGGVVRRLRVTDTPLLVDGRVAGVVEVAEDVTDRAGAFAAAETYAARLGQLAQATAELAAARDTRSVTDVVVTHAADAVEASVATVSLLSNDEILDLVAIRGGRPEITDRWASYPVSEQNPATDALRTGMPVVLVGRTAILDEYPDLAALIPDERSLVCLPLQVAERPLGVIGLVFAGARTLDERELEFLTTFADTCAQALDRVDALAEARTAAARLAFLADASGELASSLDYRVTLTNVARLAVPTLADWAAVEIVEDGRLHTLAVAHVDPAKVELAHELQERYPTDPDSPTGSPNVVRTGVSELYPEITDDMLAAGARDDEHLRISRALQLRSALVVPLAAPGPRILGAITLIQAESGRTYGRADLAMAEDLAHRAAVAIDNSELHSQTRDAAMLLQRAVLPDQVIDVPGWDIAAHYQPAGRTEVGGDFYDTISLGADRVGVVIGDVMGRGVTAAAAMAHIRSALRAYVAMDSDPATVLTKLDQMFATYDIAQLVTLLYLVADPHSTQVAVGNAGHLPPILVDADGTADILAIPPSVPLGTRPEGRDDAPLTLLPGQTLLIYTDGLVERRDEDIDVGLARLAEHAGTLATGSLSEGLSRLVDIVHDGDREDDITAVAIRFDGDAHTSTATHAPTTTHA